MVFEKAEGVTAAASEAASAFAGSFADVFERPVKGAVQLLGDKTPVAEPPKPESTAASWGAAAGRFTGNAVLWIGSSTLLGRIPQIGRAATYITGGTLGFLEPTKGDEGFGTRLLNAGEGVGAMALLDLGPKGIGALNTKLLPQSELGRMMTSSAVAGAFTTQADSLIHSGHFAGLGDTALSATIWAGTGAGAHGVASGIGKLFATRGGAMADKPAETKSTAEADASLDTKEEPYARRSAKVRMAEFGPTGAIEHEVEVPHDSPTAQIFQLANSSVHRIEAYIPQNNGIGAWVASGFVAADKNNNLRVLTTNHLVDGAVDISVFDANGRVHRAKVIKANESYDAAVLSVEGSENFVPLKLADGNVEDIAAEHGNALVAGYRQGDRRVSLLPAQAVTGNSHLNELRAFIPAEAPGDCGGACFGLNGEVLGGYRGSARDASYSRITPASVFRYLLDTSAESPNETLSVTPSTVNSTFPVVDREKAADSIGRIFSNKFPNIASPTAMHSRIVRVNAGLDNGDHQLALQLQLRPAEGQFRLRPVALDNWSLTGRERWQGTDVPINGSELIIDFSRADAPTMTSVNDPLNVLGTSLRNIDTTEYLAGLIPTINTK